MLRTICIIDTIIELDGLIPVIDRWLIGKHIITRCLGWQLLIRGIDKDIRHIEFHSWHIVEVVLWVECLSDIVRSTEVLGNTHHRVIFASHMVRHKVEHYLHASIVSTLHESLKLLDTLGWIDCKFAVNAIIVSD